MNEITLLVLLDAFRPDYLDRTRFLRGLGRRSGIGEMEEPFGFLPRLTYFAGLDPGTTGYSNIFALEPWRSPFPPMPQWSSIATAVGESNVRSRLAEEAIHRLPDFGARYADAFHIPIGDLARFAITEIESPWGGETGYRTLFHILDEAGLKWVQCAWPYTRGIAGGDPAIMGRFIDQLESDTRFGFVHLSKLDAVGHVHGPGSSELQRALEETDSLCEALYAAALERFDRVQLLVFGDHGMVTVVRSFDLGETLDASGLRHGRDYTVFIDSPMARFWFHASDAREVVVRLLERLDCGFIAEEEMLNHAHAEGLSMGNGELLFLAHPGMVFRPNNFQSRNETVLGMHGYLPWVPDNRGIFLLHDSRERRAGSFGVVKARQLFPTCLRMCGIDPGLHTELLPAEATDGAPRWTSTGDPAHEEQVQADVRRAARLISGRAPASSIVLSGSFGRGEGSVLGRPDGPCVLNDYDFAVFGPDSAQCCAPPLGPEIAQLLGIDFCDVLVFPTADLPCTQLHFDLAYGSRVVAGDPVLLDRLPRFAPAEIQIDDAAMLLLNRIAGVNLVSLPQQQGLVPMSQFGVNQLIKAWMALADFYLIRIGDYTSSYRRRAERIASLAPVMGIDHFATERMRRAFDYKLAPTAPPGVFTAEDFSLLRPQYATAFTSLETSLDAGIRRAIDASMAPLNDFREDDDLAALKLMVLGWNADGVTDIRQNILAAGAALFFADTHGEAIVKDFMLKLGAPVEPGVIDKNLDSIEKLRVLVTQAWRAVCH